MPIPRQTKTKTQVKVHDLIIQHSAYLQRLAASHADEITKIIDSSSPELVSYLKKRLMRFGVAAADKATADKFAEIEKRVAKIRGAAINEAEAALVMESLKLGDHESSFAEGTVRTLAETVAVKTLSDKAIKNISDFGTFSGKTIQQWFSGFSDADTNRVMNAVRTGVVSGQTTDQIVRALTGTPETNYTDGVLNISRNDAKAIARTATNGVANSVRKEFYEANSDVIEYLVFTATLDGRTSLICANMDGTRWKVPDELDQVRYPPLHPNCRSTVVPDVGAGLLGERPAAAADFTKLAEERYNEKQIEKGNDKRWKDLSPVTRNRYQYREQEEYEKIHGKGSAYTRVSADTTYKEWFSRQDEKFQKDILGPTRFGLYKNGEMPLDKFVDYNSNKSFNIEQLRQKDAEAFEKAGISIGKTSSPKPGASAGGSLHLTVDGSNNFPSGESFKEIKPAYDAAMKSPETFIETIRGAKEEFGAAYDKDGNLYSVGKGHASAVDIPILPESKLVIHNHPDNMPPSPTDITSFIEHKCKEMRIITDKGEYSLTSGGKSGIINIDEFVRRWKLNEPAENISAENYSNLLKEILHGSGIKTSYRKI